MPVNISHKSFELTFALISQERTKKKLNRWIFYQMAIKSNLIFIQMRFLFYFYRSCIIGAQLEVKVCTLGTVINRTAYPADYCQLEGTGRHSQPMPIRWMSWESVLLVSVFIFVKFNRTSFEVIFSICHFSSWQISSHFRCMQNTINSSRRLYRAYIMKRQQFLRIFSWLIRILISVQFVWI